MPFRQISVIEPEDVGSLRTRDLNPARTGVIKGILERSIWNVLGRVNSKLHIGEQSLKDTDYLDIWVTSECNKGCLVAAVDKAVNELAAKAEVVQRLNNGWMVFIHMESRVEEYMDNPDKIRIYIRIYYKTFQKEK